MCGIWCAQLTHSHILWMEKCINGMNECTMHSQIAIELCFFVSKKLNSLIIMVSRPVVYTYLFHHNRRHHHWTDSERSEPYTCFEVYWMKWLVRRVSRFLTSDVHLAIGMIGMQMVSISMDRRSLSAVCGVCGMVHLGRNG